MMNRQLIVLLLCLLLGLMACANEEATETPTSAPTKITTSAIIPTATPTLEPTATPQPTPTATPVHPALRVTDQVLGENGRLTIGEVALPAAGWIVVVHAGADGSEQILGQTAVAPGIYQDVVVQVDPLVAHPNLVARLHIDSGQLAVFEFPAADEPLDGATAVAFTVDIQLPAPVVTLNEQEIGEDGLLYIESIFSPMPAWLLIQGDDNGQPGSVLGQAFLHEGLNEAVVVPIRRREATPQLYAALYEDGGNPQQLEDPTIDKPLLVNQQPVVLPFRVTLPPELVVYDQPIINRQFVVDSIVSSGPGWLVVYLDDNDSPGLIIGYAPLADGVNKDVAVTVKATAVTDKLFLRFHQDTEPIGEFDLPRADLPVTVNGQVPLPFFFFTNPGNYLITRDQQPIQEEEGVTTLIVPLVVTDLTGWIVIYSDAAGQLGDILGQSWVAPGLNKNVRVVINADQATSTLYATLHLDGGTPQQFDFPNGPDSPLLRNRVPIQAPFQHLPHEQP